ncbi:hypothetical protein TYRP_015211, partial [Tyrophagus putrescentiae]
ITEPYPTEQIDKIAYVHDVQLYDDNTSNKCSQGQAADFSTRSSVFNSRFQQAKKRTVSALGSRTTTATANHNHQRFLLLPPPPPPNSAAIELTGNVWKLLTADSNCRRMSTLYNKTET